MSASSSAKAKLENIQQRILNLCKKFPQGVSEEDMKQEFKDVSSNDRVSATNALLALRRLALYQDGARLIYKEISHELAEKFKDLQQEDFLIYQIIERAGNMGIWAKDIKFRSKLQQKQVSKSLKVLKNKNLIKTVKTIHGKHKLVYMLFNIEPSRDITGGVWYQGTDYNLDLINQLQQSATDYIFSKKFGTTVEILDHIRSKGVLNGEIDLRQEDMQQIMETLVFDGLVEVTKIESKTMYIPNQTIALLQQTPNQDMYQAHLNIVKEVPCCTCPVFHLCTDGGDINPDSCVYLRDWLQINNNSTTNSSSSTIRSSSQGNSNNIGNKNSYQQEEEEIDYMEDDEEEEEED